MNSEVEKAAASGSDRAWWIQLKDLSIHVFVGVGVFILLAIPAIALDFFNQGIDMIEIQRSTANDRNGNQIQPVPAMPAKDPIESKGPIKVSQPVRYVLIGAEYVILGADVIFVVAFLSNGLWKFLRSLKWK